MRLEYAVFWSTLLFAGSLPWAYVVLLLHEPSFPPPSAEADGFVAADFDGDGGSGDGGLPSAAAHSDEPSGPNASAVQAATAACIERCALQGDGSERARADCADMCRGAGKLEVVTADSARVTCKEHCMQICMPQCPMHLKAAHCRKQCSEQCGGKCKKTTKGQWQKWKRTELPGSARAGSAAILSELDGEGDDAGAVLNAVGAGGAVVPLFI